MLSDAECRNAVCPIDKTRLRLADSGGMYLEVSPNGSKRWFYKYYKDGKEGRMALGSYPAVRLPDARAARDDAKKVKATGVDPVQAKKLAKQTAKAMQGDTFADTVALFLSVRSPEWSTTHAVRTRRIIEKDLVPKLGYRSMRDITTPELILCLREVEKRAALSVLDKAVILCGSIWDFAIAEGKADRNIARGIRKQFKKAAEGHFAGILEPERFGVLLRHIDNYQGGLIVKTALRLAPILYQRPGNLRAMKWADVDLDGGLWTIPSANMKRNKDKKENGLDHLVYLPTQAVDILRQLHAVTGRGVMVFPSERDHDRPMSDNSMRSALLSMGFSSDEQTVHGFRASARTMLAERLEINDNIMEAHMAHAVKNSLGTAYDRTTFLNQRRAMVQKWADYLDGLKAGKIVHLEQRRAA
jgi:integrase